MARSTKIVGFSLPPEVYKQLESLTKTRHKTRSEFIRELIDVYTGTISKVSPITTETSTELDLAKILRSYWELRSHFPLKILVVGLAIIVNQNRKVLIGARSEEDKWVKHLTWVFPGGSLNSLDFEAELKEKVKKEAGLDIKVNALVAARIYPDAGFKKVQIVTLYFYASIAKGKPKPADGLSKLKWVNPSDVFKHFTNSTCDEVTKFLMSLEG